MDFPSGMSHLHYSHKIDISEYGFISKTNLWPLGNREFHCLPLLTIRLCWYVYRKYYRKENSFMPGWIFVYRKLTLAVDTPLKIKPFWWCYVNHRVRKFAETWQSCHKKCYKMFLKISWFIAFFIKKAIIKIFSYKIQIICWNIFTVASLLRRGYRLKTLCGRKKITVTSPFGYNPSLTWLRLKRVGFAILMLYITTVVLRVIVPYLCFVFPRNIKKNLLYC